jgi:hypothetical protein
MNTLISGLKQSVSTSIVKTGVLVCVFGILQGCHHYVMEVPKAPEEISTMKPYDNAVWVNGEWEWRKGHHEWKSGHYNPPHRNSAYVAGEWKKSRKGYYYVHGRWKKIKAS